MKKTVIIITCLLFTFIGCDKSQSDLNTISVLAAELNSLANLKINGLIELDPCYSNNPYDAWGESLFIGMKKLSKTKSESGNILISDRDEFEKKLRIEIPQEYLHLDIKNVNIKNVETLCDEFLSLYVKRNIFETLYLSKKMENHVIQSRILNEVDKAYLLKFVSLVRYSTYFNYTLTNISKGSFEKCWKRELQKIEDMGFFSRAACVIDWPVCLAAVAADCLIEELRD